jgi:hypothetical protein
MMGILKMIDYTRGSHNVYKERYTDLALWQKEFDADIRFWLKFNADWYESVILSKENMTVAMKSINCDTLGPLNIPAVNKAIDIFHAKGMTNIIGINYNWNEEVVAQSMQISTSIVRQRLSIGSYMASPSPSPTSAFLKFLVLVGRISVAPSFMEESFCWIARWHSCMTPCLAR